MSRATPEQQAARVNVDDATWRRFRVLALKADRSIADYLGELVRDELQRAKRRARVAEPREEDSTRTARTSAAVKEDNTPTTPDRQTSRRVRLSDVELLTGLPVIDSAATKDPAVASRPAPRRRQGR